MSNNHRFEEKTVIATHLEESGKTISLVRCGDTYEHYMVAKSFGSDPDVGIQMGYALHIGNPWTPELLMQVLSDRISRMPSQEAIMISAQLVNKANHMLGEALQRR